MNDLNDHDDEQRTPDDELVAYLDGELDDDACRSVEQRLSSDALYRRQLQELERAWDCLDALPQHTVDERFARSTIEMVAVAASQDLDQQRAAIPAQRRTRAVLAAGILLACLLAGFLVAAAAWPDPNRQLVADLPLLENLDWYLQVDSLDYLKRLQQEEALVEIEPADQVVEEPSPLRAALAATAPHERRAAIAALPPDAKARLADKHARLNDLSPELQQRVRKLHEDIRAEADSDALLATLARYHEQLRKLPEAERNNLLALDEDERMNRLRRAQGAKQIQVDRGKWFRAQQEQRLAQQMEPLTPKDVGAILSWLEEYLLAHREPILASLPEPERQRTERRLASLPDSRQQAAMLLFAWSKSQAGFKKLTAPPLFGEDDLQSLSERLSPPTRKHLGAISPPERQRATLRKWVQAAIRLRLASHMPGHDRPTVSGESLEEFFEHDLPPEKREQLLSIPDVDAMERELRQLYFQAHGARKTDHPRGGPSLPGLRQRPGGGHWGPGRRDWDHGSGKKPMKPEL